MTLGEFKGICNVDNVEVYSHNSQIIDWYENDPRYNCTVLGVGILDEETMYVDIDEDEVKEI